MKKIGVLFICLSLFLILIQLVNVQAQDIGEGLEDIEEQLQEGVEKVEDVTSIFEEEKWDYLGKEWKEILLKKKFVSSIDSFLTKISIVFVILFGQSYSLSLPLLFVIMLWFYFFLKFSEIFTDYSSFSSATAMVMGFAFTIILAQFQILRKIIEFFGRLVLSRESNIWRFLIMLGIFGIMILLYYLSSHFGDSFKKNKEKREKSKEEIEKSRAKADRRTLRKFMEAVMKGLKTPISHRNKTVRSVPKGKGLAKHKTYRLENKTVRFVPRGKDLTKHEVESYHKIKKSKSHKDWDKRTKGK